MNLLKDFNHLYALYNIFIILITAQKQYRAMQADTKKVTNKMICQFCKKKVSKERQKAHLKKCPSKLQKETPHNIQEKCQQGIVKQENNYQQQKLIQPDGKIKAFYFDNSFLKKQQNKTNEYKTESAKQDQEKQDVKLNSANQKRQIKKQNMEVQNQSKQSKQTIKRAKLSNKQIEQQRSQAKQQIKEIKQQQYMQICNNCKLQIKPEQLSFHEAQCGTMIECLVCKKKIKIQLYDNHEGACQLLRSLAVNNNSNANSNNNANNLLNNINLDFFQLFMDNINNDYNNQIQDILTNDVFPAFKKLDKGLKQADIEKLNVYTYPYKRSQQSDECSICQQDIRPSVKVIQLKCRHMFHKRCISDWLIRTSCCPNCNKDVKDQQ